MVAVPGTDNQSIVTATATVAPGPTGGDGPVEAASADEAAVGAAGWADTDESDSVSAGPV